VRRIEPAFPPPVWNVHDITVNSGDRTNNYCEAWNRRFETLLGHKNPSVWTTLEVLGDDAAEAATMLVRHGSGRLEPRRVRKSTRDFQQRMQHLCSELADGSRDTASFLRAVGHSIRLIG